MTKLTHLFLMMTLGLGAFALVGCEENHADRDHLDTHRKVEGGDASMGRAPAGYETDGLKTTPQAKQPSFVGDSN